MQPPFAQDDTDLKQSITTCLSDVVARPSFMAMVAVKLICYEVSNAKHGGILNHAPDLQVPLALEVNQAPLASKVQAPLASEISIHASFSWRCSDYRLIESQLTDICQGKTYTYRMTANQQVHGELSLLFHENHPAIDSSEMSALVQSLTEIIVADHRRRQLTSGTFRAHQWLGYSPAIREIEASCRRFASVDFPVLVRGQHGSGKRLAAHQIHQLSHRRHQVFIECHCDQMAASEQVSLLKEAYEKARQGTLFLRDIDALDSSTLDILRHFWQQQYLDKTPEVRIIASIGHLTRPFNAERYAPWLSLSLPNLNQRREDIAHLIEWYLHKYAVSQIPQLDQDCLLALSHHEWQDNAKGLERAIALLCVSCMDGQIDRQLLIKCLPEFRESDSEEQASDGRKEANPRQSAFDALTATRSVNQESPPAHVEARARQTPETSIDILVKDVLSHSFQRYEAMHPALASALSHLAENFQHAPGINDLADAAYVSQSHLSYLFRIHLKHSFKTLLTHVRIEKAKRMMRQNPGIKITNLALEVGYRDLSHFQKSFKRLLKMSPREYKMRQLQGNQHALADAH